MSGNPYSEKRRERAAQLVTEGYSAEVWKWLTMIVQRDASPALALGSDHLFSELKLEFPLAQPGDLLLAIHAEERAIRRAEKKGEHASQLVITPEQSWLRKNLAVREPSAAWGMARQLELLAQAAVDPKLGNNAAELYKRLRAELKPNEIMLLASEAQRCLRKSKKSEDSK
jgi:hypothetical protein